jgi:zinc transporter
MKSAVFTYGSDQGGLIWGFVFSGGGKARTIGSVEAAEWLRRDSSEREGEFIWLHFNLSNAASERWISEHGNLVDEFFDALHQGSRSTRIELVEDTLIAVVNDVAHNFSFEPSDISTVVISVDSNVMISARRAPLKSIERVRQEVEARESIRSTVEILALLLQGQADILLNIMREAVSRVDKVEDGLLADRLSRRKGDLGSLRRVLVRLRRLLAPEPASLFRLLQRPPSWVVEDDVQELRQATEEFAVVLNDMAALQERIKLLQEEIAAHVNEGTSRSLFLLTIVTVLALPINIIAGLFGMNVGGIPLASDDKGFWIIVGLVASFTAVAGWLVVRRQQDD